MTFTNLKHHGSNLGPSGTELGALPTELKLLLQRQVPTRPRIYPWPFLIWKSTNDRFSNKEWPCMGQPDAIRGHSLFENRSMVDFQIRNGLCPGSGTGSGTGSGIFLQIRPGPDPPTPPPLSPPSMHPHSHALTPSHAHTYTCTHDWL